MLERAKVADVVARDDQDVTAPCLIVQAREARHEVEKLVRLQQELRVVGGVPHRGCELKLPMPHTHTRDALQQFLEVTDRRPADLRVDARRQPICVSTPQRLNGLLERSSHPAESVVVVFHSID
jgi:hypothetical protein